MEGQTAHADDLSPPLHIHRTGELQPDRTAPDYWINCCCSDSLDGSILRHAEAVSSLSVSVSDTIRVSEDESFSMDYWN